MPNINGYGDIYNSQMSAFQNSEPNNMASYGWWNVITGKGSELGTQNLFSAEQAAMANQFAHDEAALNRDFQERMSNTQYQRAFADMKAAGINPLNMGGIEGASVGTTAAAQAHQGSPASASGNGFGSFLVGLLKLGAALASSGASAAAQAGHDATNIALGKLKAESALDVAGLKSRTAKDIALGKIGDKNILASISRLDKIISETKKNINRSESNAIAFGSSADWSKVKALRDNLKVLRAERDLYLSRVYREFNLK